MLDYASMAADVLGFIRDHELETPALIGHSMFVDIISKASRPSVSNVI